MKYVIQFLVWFIANRRWKGDVICVSEIMVTVVCTTYNQDKYIRKALEGIVSQKTNFRYEVLVHDDASTDQTVAIINEYAEKYKGLIVPILEEENQFSKGVRITKDMLIPLAKGKYIALCEGDDYWTDANKLQIQFDAMEQHPECSICVHRVQGVSEDENKRLRTYPMKEMCTGILSAKEIMHRMLAEGEWVYHTTSYFFCKKDALEMSENKYVFWIKAGYGDFSYMQMAALKGDFYYIDQIMSVYRMGAIGSLLRNDRNSERFKEKNLRFINSVKDFDEVSQHRFHEDAKIAISRYQFQLAYVDNDYAVLLSPEMHEFWKAMPLRAKMKVRISYYLPCVNEIYRRLRYYIKGSR